LRAVGEGVAAAVGVGEREVVTVPVGLVVAGPGVGGVVGALALGAVSDETTRMAITNKIVSMTTVTAARTMPRRGFG
jgi:hypothetical protein